MFMESAELIEVRKKFKEYYELHLVAKFSALEAMRKKYLRIFWLTVVFIFGIMPVGVFAIIYFLGLGQHIDSRIIGDYLGVLVGIGLFCAFVISLPNHFYKKKVKSMLMVPFVGFFGSFVHKCGGGIPSTVVEKSGLIGYFDSSNTDDNFCGKYKDVDISISEENFKKTVHTKKGSRTVTVFKGVLILLDMNKKFEGQTVVKKDHGWLINKVNGCSGFKKVELEDVVFEKYFEAYSNNQIEARYILTTAFMERIIKLRDSFMSKNIEFSFFDNKLFITMKTDKNMFEIASIFTSSTDYEYLEKIFDQFYAIFSIIDILKLDKKAIL